MGRRSNNVKGLDQKDLSRELNIRKRLFKHEKQNRVRETSRYEHHGKEADQNASSCSAM